MSAKKKVLKTGQTVWFIRPWANGKQLYETFGTKGEADRRGREIENQLDKKQFTAKKDVPLVNAACDLYLQGRKDEAARHGGKRTDSTLDFYENHIENFIKTAIGAMKVSNVDRTVALNCRTSWKEKLSSVSVNKVLMTARGVFDEQVVSGVIPINPFKLVKNLARDDDKQQDKMMEVDPAEVYSRAEIQTILANASSERDRLMIKITAEAGLRDGELLGTKEDDVLPNVIQVRQQWSYSKFDNDGAPILGKLKTPQSRRDVPITDELSLELKKWKLANSANNPHGLMFPNSRGLPCNRKDLWKAITRAVTTANGNGAKLEYHNFYSLRHHFASLLINRGVPAIEIAKLMGHKNTIVTLTVYARFMKTESSYDPNQVFGQDRKKEVK